MIDCEYIAEVAIMAARKMNRLGTGARFGFTLVEILLVVAILGVLASIVVKTFADVTQDAAQTVFATDLKIYAKSAYLFQQETGDFPEDSGTGVCPAGWEPYIDELKWEAGTPIGGQWDFEFDSFGMTSGFGVHFQAGPRKDDEYMTGVDLAVDDGNLATGAFQKIADDRYYYVLLQ